MSMRSKHRKQTRKKKQRRSENKVRHLSRRWVETRKWFVKPRDKGKIRAGLRPFTEIMDAADRTCMFVEEENGELCGKRSEQNCHLIPESAILDGLADCKSGKVLELRWTISGWKQVFERSDEATPVVVQSSDTFDPFKTPLEVGKGLATTGHFACKPHDDVFQPVDEIITDVPDTGSMFLMGYRALLYVAGLVRRSRAVLNDAKVGKQVMRQNNQMIRMKWWKLQTATKFDELERRVIELGDAWNNCRDSISTAAKLIRFRSHLQFAAAGILGNAYQSVLIYPSTEGPEYMHNMLIIQIGAEDDSAAEIRHHLESTGQKTLGSAVPDVSMLCDIMKHSTGSIATSLASYDGAHRRGT